MDVPARIIAASKAAIVSSVGGQTTILLQVGDEVLSKRPLNSQYKVEVYTDGNCNLCRWMRARVEPLDRDRRIDWLDYNDPEILTRAAPRTREAMAEEMHVRLPGGHWSKGYAGWIEVISVLPRWKWLAPIMSVWPFTKVGPIVYRWLAARRYTLFGVPPPCDASGVCQLHK